MNCDCSIYDGEILECFNSITRKARKNYICGECRQPILVGDKYQYETGLLYGSGFETHRTCLTCYRVRKDYCSSFIFGHLWESIRECLGKECVPSIPIVNYSK